MTTQELQDSVNSDVPIYYVDENFGRSSILNYDKQLKEENDIDVKYNMKFLQTPTVVGLQDFDIPTQDNFETEITVTYHSKVSGMVPNCKPLTSTVESLLVRTDNGVIFYWTAHKDKRYIARKFNSYR